MTIIYRKIDHIVYTVADLDEAIIEFEQKLGVRPIFSGYHKTFGTKNALINLNKNMYLELLAVDDDNAEVPPPRWMGVDLLHKNQITRWAVKSESLKRDSAMLKSHHPEMGKIQAGSRNTADGSLLQWQLSMPLPAPEVELVPFILDWSATDKHPSELLPDMECRLIELYGTHPNPETYATIFKDLECDFQIKKSDTIELKMILNCPNGVIEI